MNTMLEVLKEKGDYEKIKEAIKNIFRLEDWQNGLIKNMENFFEEIQLPEGWTIKLRNWNQYFYTILSLDMIIKNKDNIKIAYFQVKLQVKNLFDYIVEVKDIYFFFDDYILNLEWNSQQNVDFNKLLTKYNEFKKIIMEVEK